MGSVSNKIQTLNTSVGGDDTSMVQNTKSFPSVPILNRFEYSTGNAPSIVAFEAIIGFSLTDGLKTGDVITFSDSGYSVPASAFNLNTSLISVDTLALTTNSQSFRACTNLTYFSAPILTTLGSNCMAFNSGALTYNIPSVTNIGNACFVGNLLVSSFEFPLTTTLGNTIFDDCVGVTVFNLSSVTNLGGTVANNNVFRDILGKTITITVPSAIMTANAGSPDGDIQYLQANNTVTVITV